MPSSPLLTPQRDTAALLADARGSVLIETALSLPILILFLVGILTYGGWIMAAHSVQQAANEGARAALAGLDDAERRTIAVQTVTRTIGDGSMVNPSLIATSAARTSDGYLTVTVTYDAPRSALFTSAIVPLPPGPIRRASVVRLGNL
ncbi:MAG: TadE/TadG family type IV pilus assembly protein [Sphingobium sp.]